MIISATCDQIRGMLEEFKADRALSQFGILVFTICLALIGGHIATLEFSGAPKETFGFKLWNELRLDRDGSVPERVGHGFAMIAAAFFLLGFLTSGFRSFLLMASISIYIWFDDSSSFHERAGREISEHFGFEAHWGLRPQDFGEVTVWISVGVMFTLTAAMILRRPKEGDLVVMVLGLLPFGLIAVCGIVFDMLHQLNSGIMSNIFAVVEDGGELIGLGGLATVSAGLLRARV